MKEYCVSSCKQSCAWEILSKDAFVLIIFLAGLFFLTGCGEPSHNVVDETPIVDEKFDKPKLIVTDEEFLEALPDRESSPEEMALELIERELATKDVVELLLREGGTQEQLTVLWAMHIAKTPRVDRRLIASRLNSVSWELRMMAALCLDGKEPLLPNETTSLAWRVVNDDVLNVRIRCIGTLAKGDPDRQDVREAFEAALDHQSAPPLLSIAALRSMAEHPELCKVLAYSIIAQLRSSDVDVAEAVERTLGRCGHVCLGALFQTRKTAPMEFAQRIEGVLDRLKPKDALPMAIKLIREAPDVHGPASASFVAKFGENAVPELGESLATETDVAVLRWLVQAVAEIGVPASSTMEQLVMVAKTTNDKKLRWAVIRAIGAVGEADKSKTIVQLEEMRIKETDDEILLEIDEVLRQLVEI